VSKCEQQGLGHQWFGSKGFWGNEKEENHVPVRTRLGRLATGSSEAAIRFVPCGVCEEAGFIPGSDFKYFAEFSLAVGRLLNCGMWRGSKYLRSGNAGVVEIVTASVTTCGFAK